MARYFLIGATRDHVLLGAKGGFVQAGHGRKDLMSKPEKGDWIVYYSAKDKFGNGKPLQKFTAIAQIIDDEPYQPNAKRDLKPNRRNADFKPGEETDIRPLLEKLSFIKNTKHWGFYLMSGFRELSKEDFTLIK